MVELIFALWRRDMIKFLRDRQNILASLARPFLWLFALGFGLRRSVQIQTGGLDFISFLVPGIAAMTVLFAAMFAAISIVWDREFGFLKTLLVAPVPRGAIVAAKMAAGSTMGVLEAGVMMLLSPLLGARLDPAGAVVALLLLAVFGMAVNALGIAIAAGMKSFEGFGGVVNFLIQPIFFLSGALYPLQGIPRALRVVVLVNPMSYAVDAVRGVTIGVHHFPYALDAFALAATTAALAMIATRRFRRMEA
jgi:ABC-2 type transport system permease protein